MAPTLAEAEVVGQVCGLRPCSADHLPLIGAVPGWPGVYMVAGHFRSGMLLSTISTYCIADLIRTGKSPMSLAAFDPARFTPTLQAAIANLAQELLAQFIVVRSIGSVSKVEMDCDYWHTGPHPRSLS